MFADCLNRSLVCRSLGVGAVVHVANAGKVDADARTRSLRNLSPEGTEEGFNIGPWNIRPCGPSEDRFQGAAVLSVHISIVPRNGTTVKTFVRVNVKYETPKKRMQNRFTFGFLSSLEL